MSDAKDIAAREAHLRAEQEAEAGTAQIAAVYAKALLAAAEKAGQTDALLDEFQSLVVDVLDTQPRLETVLASAIISGEEKGALLDRLLGGQASALLLNFLKVAARRGRLDCLRAMYRETREQYDKLRGRVSVQLSTAVPIDAAALARVAGELRARLGGEPLVSHVVRPEIIGGAVLRVGDTIYDGSVANQLENLRQQMIDRSVHEIQSR